MAGYCLAYPSWPRDTRGGLSADSDIQVVDVEFSQHPRGLVTIAAGYFPIGRAHAAGQSDIRSAEAAPQIRSLWPRAGR